MINTAMFIIVLYRKLANIWDGYLSDQLTSRMQFPTVLVSIGFSGRVEPYFES